MQKIGVSVPAVNVAGVPHFPIAIPTNQAFCQQWLRWIYKKVDAHFKRNKERVPDTVQNVIMRLLSKDMIGRWFFKHLSDELVDRGEAERILGLTTDEERARGISRLAFISQLDPVLGHRGNPASLWRIRDLLLYAKFDYERFYYSIQNHTIDSEKVLRLLGYGTINPDGTFTVSPGGISVLESMYRQGRLRPAELTEHHCTERYEPRDSVTYLCTGCFAAAVTVGGKSFRMLSGSEQWGPEWTSGKKAFKTRCPHGSEHCGKVVCSEPGCVRRHFSRGYCNVHYGSKFKVSGCHACDHGRRLLADRGLALTNRWDSPKSAAAAMKLRWNDSQLKEFLRDWRRTNIVACTPRHIMRPSRNQGIDAGLLKYAKTIIDNATVNDFKTITRSDDLANMVLNNGKSPELSEDESMAWEGDKENPDGTSERVVRDANALVAFRDFENRYDAYRMIRESGISDEEMTVVASMDVEGQSVRDCAAATGKTVKQVSDIRAAALAKLRSAEQGMGSAKPIPADIAQAAVERVCSAHGIDTRDLFGPATMGAPVLARTDLYADLLRAGFSDVDIAARFSIPVDKVRAGLARAARRAGVTLERLLAAAE